MTVKALSSKLFSQNLRISVKKIANCADAFKKIYKKKWSSCVFLHIQQAAFHCKYTLEGKMFDQYEGFV